MGKLSNWIRARARFVAVLLVLALAAGGGYRVWAGRRARPAPVGGPGTLATAVATMGDIEVAVTGTAPLQPGGSQDVRSLVGGTVRRIHVSEGQTVAAGQVLAELENEGVMLALEQAQLAYEADLEQLAELRAQSGGDESATRSAQLAVATAKLNLERLEKQVDALVVKAPGPGEIAELPVRQGDQVSPGALLAAVLSGSPGQVSITVPEDRILDVKLGDEASVILAPLPEVHVVRLSLIDETVYGLRIGDRLRATVDGQWIPGTGGSVTAWGTVVSIQRSLPYFEIVCRLPGVPSGIPDGAKALYMEIYPTGEQSKGQTIIAGGELRVVVDEWGLDQAHLDGEGRRARISSIGAESQRDAQGRVVYPVTLELAEESATPIRSGMSAHAMVIPAKGDPLGALTTYQAPYHRITASDGGKVEAVYARAGQRVQSGDILMLVSNPTLEYQLEQARAELRLAENKLRDLSLTDRAAREIRSLEIRVRQAEMALETRYVDADALVVRANTSGRIVGWSQEISLGQTLGAGHVWGRIVNYEQMSVTISVDELQIVALRPGMQAQVSVDALPGRPFAARVRSIASEGQYQMGVSSFEVTLEVEGAPELRAQMTANARIQVAERQGVLLVPAEAVTIFGDGGAEVTVIDGRGVPAPRRVQIGLYNHAQVEVTGGLTEGEQVVLGVGRQNPGAPWMTHGVIREGMTK